MTAEQIQGRFGISRKHALECEAWVAHQYHLIARHSPAWWQRDGAAIRTNVGHCLAELITDIWKMPRVKEAA